MSAISAPFGLRPAFHPSGLDRAQALANGIPSGYATNILSMMEQALTVKLVEITGHLSMLRRNAL
jgi:hypothetical protein